MPKIKLMFGDCLERMKEIPDKSIDLVVTSPPYDNLRTYNGTLEWSFEIFQNIANELKRVLKKGGVIVWVVGDATIKGSETGSGFRQALHFKEIGLNIHDTMIYAKNNVVPLTHNRYEQAFEYMFIFSNGKPEAFNPIEDKPNRYAGSFVHGTQYNGDTPKRVSGHNTKKVKEFGRRHNIFYYNNQGDRRIKHPATFPLKLAQDHILSWSNEGDLVLDPFMGSGTTGVACKNLNRNFIGIEKDKEYFKIAKERIVNAN
jgi:DNA modification methylase